MRRTRPIEERTAGEVDPGRQAKPGRDCHRAPLDARERYALATSAGKVGMWDWDLASGDIFVDPAVNELLGYQDHELGNRFDQWSQLIHPEDREPVQRAIEAHRSGLTSAFQIEHRMLRRDGGVRWVLTRGVCRRDADGHARRMVGAHVDITDRKQESLVQAENEARYHLLTEYSTDLISTHDVQGRYLYASPSCQAMLGYDSTQLLGHSVFRFVHPDDIPGVAQVHATLLEPGASDGLRATFRAQRADGTYAWVESSYQVVHDAQRTATGFVCVTRDISQRKETEDKLRESEARFRTLTELSSDWYWEQDENLRFVAFAAGCSRLSRVTDTLLGRTRWEGPPVLISEAERRAFDALQQARQPFRDVIIPRRLADGSVRVISISGTPIFDAAGRFRGYRGVGCNITEQERLRRAVAESEQRMRLALEYGNVGVWERDLISERVRWSPNVGPMFGLAADVTELTSAEVFERFHPLDRARLGVAMGGVSDTQLEQGFEHRVVWPDGTVRWLFQRGHVVRAVNGEAKCRLGIVQDVTERKQTEIALRTSEERFRVLMDLSSDYYWEQDAQFRFTVLRRGGFGAAPPPETSGIGKAPWEIDELMPPPEGWEARRATLEQHLPFRDAIRRRRFPNGEERILSVSGFPAFDLEGRFEGYRGVIQDITARERAHQRIRESEARFRALTELSSDWYWEQDEQLRFTMISDNFYRLMKWPPGSHLGETRWEAAHTGVPEEVWARHKRMVAAHKPFYDLVIQRLDGEGCLRTHSVSGTPVFDETGRFRGYRGIARDITNAKAAEDAVRESEQRFRLLAESTRDVIWISDPAISRIDYVTPAVQDVWGIPAAKLMSRPSTWMELVHSEDVDIAQAALQNQIRGQPIDVEFRIVRPEGELRWLWVRSTPTRDSRGEAIVCGITEDITRRKLEQLQKLEEAVRQRDALVREVHHRIKNSLQGVAGLLRSHAHRNRLAAASLETAISQIQAIATVHGLQAMGRSGGVDIARVAEAIARMLENLTQTAIRLEGFEASGRRFILAEGEAVATALILNELIVNAVKHRPAGDTTSDVCVSLRAGSPSVEIQVCNRGALPTAFDLSRRTGLGTGLELVCALLPKRGLVLSIGAGSGWVSSSLILSAPVIQPTEPTMGERLS